MKKLGIYPSIMCCKPWDVKAFIEKFEEYDITSIHFDVMDGHYVPNVMLGSAFFKDIASITKLPIDVHLMTLEPEKFVEYFPFRENDYCCFHPETTNQPYRLLQQIKSKGVKAGYAISPATSIEYIKNSLSVLDYVLVMSINPGFAAQKMVPDHLPKLKEISELCAKADHKIEIIVDGNTTAENTKKMIENGADGVVAGTSSLLKYGPETFDKYYHDYMEAIK